MPPTEAEWIRILSMMSPPDLRAFHDFAVAYIAHERTGETADLDAAWQALEARLKERQRIANG